MSRENVTRGHGRLDSGETNDGGSRTEPRTVSCSFASGSDNVSCHTAGLVSVKQRIALGCFFYRSMESWTSDVACRTRYVSRSLVYFRYRRSHHVTSCGLVRKGLGFQGLTYGTSKQTPANFTSSVRGRMHSRRGRAGMAV